jgi:hypothetical protein
MQMAITHDAFLPEAEEFGVLTYNKNEVIMCREGKVSRNCVTVKEMKRLKEREAQKQNQLQKQIYSGEEDN